MTEQIAVAEAIGWFLLVVIIAAVAIEILFTRSKHSWESCMAECKRLRKDGKNPTMAKTSIGWKVVEND